MEPISVNLGVLIPEKEIIQRVRDLCRRYGTLFIADEVACGFGRTGRNALLVSTEGSTVLLPSLVIDQRTAARGLDVLARSI